MEYENEYAYFCLFSEGFFILNDCLVRLSVLALQLLVPVLPVCHIADVDPLAATGTRFPDELVEVGTESDAFVYIPQRHLTGGYVDVCRLALHVLGSGRALHSSVQRWASIA